MEILEKKIRKDTGESNSLKNKAGYTNRLNSRGLGRSSNGEGRGGGGVPVTQQHQSHMTGQEQ